MNAVKTQQKTIWECIHCEATQATAKGYNPRDTCPCGRRDYRAIKTITTHEVTTPKNQTIVYYPEDNRVEVKTNGATIYTGVADEPLETPIQVSIALNATILETGEYLNQLFDTRTEKINSIPYTPNHYQLALEYLEQQPIYYDENKKWWLWRENKHKWVMSDETDLLARLDQAINTPQNTIKNKAKNELLEAIRRVARQKQPKPFQDTWVQYGNEIWDARTNEKVTDATPDYFATNPIPWTISGNTETPNIDRLFTEWVGAEYRETLHEIIAYTTLQSQALQRMFAFVGAGANGKGTLLQVMIRFLGRENIATTELKYLTTKNFEATVLYRKLAVLMTEVEENDLKSTNLLKSLTGGDPIRFEFKGHDPFTDYSYATPILATNALPETQDKTQGNYRRWLVIDFPNTFTINPNLLDCIPDKEYNNLATRALQTAKRLLEAGKFTNEGTIAEREKKYEDRANPVGSFIEQHCEQDLAGEFAPIKFQEFYVRLNEWLRKNNHRQMNAKRVSRALEKQGFNSIRGHEVTPEGHEKRPTLIEGLAWKVLDC